MDRYNLIRELIRKMHDSPYRAYCACTGAGAGLTNLLWGENNSSATILGSRFPYDQVDMEDFVGRRPKRFVSQDTAEMMAAAAFSQARSLAVRKGGSGSHLLGLGLTATVKTGRPKRGDHRMYLAVHKDELTYRIYLKLKKGILTRKGEGSVCDLAGLMALAWAAGLTEGPAMLRELSGVEKVEYDTRRYGAPGNLDLLPARVMIGLDGTVRSNFTLDSARHVLFPVSANPLHCGHESVAAAAATLRQKEVVFHMTCHHPVKGEIPRAELFWRAAQFRFRYRVIIDDDSGLYLDKARRYRGIDLLLGADAALALLNPKYYGNEDGLQATLAELKDVLKTRFLLSGRVYEGKYMDPSEIPVPDGFHELFIPVSCAGDVSSSEIRRRQAAGL